MGVFGNKGSRELKIVREARDHLGRPYMVSCRVFISFDKPRLFMFKHSLELDVSSRFYLAKFMRCE